MVNKLIKYSNILLIVLLVFSGMYIQRQCTTNRFLKNKNDELLQRSETLEHEYDSIEGVLEVVPARIDSLTGLIDSIRIKRNRLRLQNEQITRRYEIINKAIERITTGTQYDSLLSEWYPAPGQRNLPAADVAGGDDDR